MTFEAEAPSLDGLIQWVEKWIGNYEDRQHGRRGRPLQPYEQRELSAYRGIHAALSDLQQARSELETRPAVEHVAEPDCACRECTAAEKPACNCEGPQKIGPGYHAPYCATMAGTEFAKQYASDETSTSLTSAEEESLRERSDLMHKPAEH